MMVCCYMNINVAEHDSIGKEKKAIRVLVFFSVSVVFECEELVKRRRRYGCLSCVMLLRICKLRETTDTLIDAEYMDIIEK